MSILSSFVPALKQPESPKGGQSGCHSARLRCWLPCCGFLKNDLLLHRPCEQLISAGGEGKTDPFERPPATGRTAASPAARGGGQQRCCRLGTASSYRRVSTGGEKLKALPPGVKGKRLWRSTRGCRGGMGSRPGEGLELRLRREQPPAGALS